jgi:NosR/NirI family nitrous oxide reductase transcriptional regulator
VLNFAIQALCMRTLLILTLGLIFPSISLAMFTVTQQQQIETIQQSISGITKISGKQPLEGTKVLARSVFADEEIIAYAFNTNDVINIPAYSGKPINTLIVMDIKGKIVATRVLEHHEPILLVGIPEKKLFDFADKYQGLMVTDTVGIGAGNKQDVINIDIISGATVTVMVVNEAIMRSAKKVASILEIAGFSLEQKTPPASIKDLSVNIKDWGFLTGDGSIRRLLLDNKAIDESFVGTIAQSEPSNSQAQIDFEKETFIDLFFTPLSIPTIGKSLLGEKQFNWLRSEIGKQDIAIAVMANGEYSFKGNGYVRGGIFDRTQLQQSGKTISFRDSDYYRLDDVFIEGFPGFHEMAIFIIRDAYEFDIGSPWQLELLVRRQVGALDSVFTSFNAPYSTPEQYLDRPEPIIEAEPQPLWVSVWQQKQFQIVILTTALVLLFIIIFIQDILVRKPKLMHGLRQAYLVFTVVFIGWYALGQLSVVNVFTFVHALQDNFNWNLFLLDPILFILWGFVAMTMLLWGRGIFCGWLCPFGALQELINEAARRFKIKQYEIPFAVHERLWALKYVILLALFAVSLESVSQAERLAEIEPFKTTFLLKFQREWGYILYVILLLVINVFTRKVYCRYICPLGAALAIPARLRLFDWLKRRKECGQPCRICANECEIQAIHPDGHINANECHQCLDCQVTYYQDKKCPPLVKKMRKKQKLAAAVLNMQAIEIKEIK